LIRGWRIAVLLCALWQANPLLAQELDLRLRITWGNRSSTASLPRHWSGTFELSDGSFSELGRLGYEANAPTSIVNTSRKLHVWQPTAVTFDGFDVRILASETATLTITLVPDREAAAEQRFSVPLAPFVSQLGHGQSLKLDEQGNGLIIHRAPGDHLRVKFQRDSLVFAPREPWTFELQPHRLGFAPQTPLRCALQLRDSRTGDELWGEQHDLLTDEFGSARPIGPVTIELPEREGVYELVVAVRERKFAAALLLERKVQLIVLAEQAASAGDETWREVGDVQPGNPKWWEGWKWLPSLRLTSASPGPLDNGKLSQVEHLGQSLTQLDAGGWQAAPLPILRPGLPHILEIEYPADSLQTLGISVLQPDAAGEVKSLGLDSGVDVIQTAGDVAAMQKHRLVFWPRVKAPWLLLNNRRDDRPARFGKIRVLAGPARLPDAALAAPADGRVLAAYFEQPLFPENFCAAEALDPLPQRSLEDWTTFYEGGQRLVEYLKHVGYNAAIISAARGGGTLYPAQQLDSTPRYDSGLMFVSGQDPQQKDVLELLFRLFDREGLQLVPALHLAVPLPALERMRNEDRVAAVGIELIGSDGQAWPTRHGTNRGQAAYYNILDERVQGAIRDAVEELVTRYAQHASFGGIALQLGPHTYVDLPDITAGNDDRTIGRFRKDNADALLRLEAESDKPFFIEGAGRFVARSAFLTGPGRKLWLDWRAKVLTEFYADVQADLARTRPESRLYLATNELIAAGPVYRELYPKLPARGDLADAMLQHGLDAARLKGIENLVLLRPQRLKPLTELAEQAVNLQLRYSPTADTLFHTASVAGALNYHEPMTLSLPSFDAASPFGAEKTHTWLAAIVPPNGAHHRASFIHGLATLDAQVLAEGGWMLPLGQEDALRRQIAMYRQLPAAAFASPAPRSTEAKASSVVVRTLHRDGRTYFYVVNDAPWPVTAEVEFKAAPLAVVQRFGTDAPERPTFTGSAAIWPVSLEAYDLVAGYINDPQAVITDWHAQYEPLIKEQLANVVADVKFRVNELDKRSPLTAVANADFEQADAMGEPAHWTYSRGPGATVRLDTQGPLQGRRSLHIQGDGSKTVWVRSQPFPPPHTGRISVLAWIRTRDPNQQPSLRLAVDNARGYYRFATLGVELDPRTGKPTGGAAESLTSDWPAQPYLLHIHDLPTTGLGELMIGFDLTSRGEVWIDDVQVFDLYFLPEELKELVKDVATVHFQLDEGRLADCERFLGGYWPRFVLAHVPPRRVAEAPSSVPPLAPVTTPATTPPANPPAPADAPSGWRRYIPSWKLPFRRE